AVVEMVNVADPLTVSDCGTVADRLLDRSATLPDAPTSVTVPVSGDPPIVLDALIDSDSVGVTGGGGFEPQPASAVRPSSAATKRMPRPINAPRRRVSPDGDRLR